MGLHVPMTRRAGRFNRWWLVPTSLIGHSLARFVGAQGPKSVGGRCATAQYYVLPDRFPWWFGAVTLGHVILVQSTCMVGESGKWTMAHELAHTRQHDVLGPLYLPAHALCQLLSALISLVRPVPGYSRFHAYNPLERGFLCVPFDVLVDLRRGLPVPVERAEAVLAALGVTDFGSPLRSAERAEGHRTSIAPGP